MEKVDRAIILHPLVDLSQAWPLLFVQNLKLVFTCGSGKSGSKFQHLRNQMVKSLPSAPAPGPCTFIVKSLEALLLLEPPHNEGLSHLLISALGQLDRSYYPPEDAIVARQLASALFYNAIVGNVLMEPRIVVKLPLTFDFVLKDVGSAIHLLSSSEDVSLKAAKAAVQDYVVHLLKMRSYTGAVSLLKTFDLHEHDSETLLINMASEGQTKLAGEWAGHLGHNMVKFFVQHCMGIGLFKTAYKLVQQYKLEDDFPDAYLLYRQSSLRKLVNKGLWDIAQCIAEEDSQLVDYLLKLALEDGDATKVVEICEHFQVDPLLYCLELQSCYQENKFLQLKSLISEENLKWVDTFEGLDFAAASLSQVNVVGIDCEWKPDKSKGLKANKVSILQVASTTHVFIIDLITLSKEQPEKLDSFITALFHSPSILKLGYAMHNDLVRLSRSYRGSQGFLLCEPVLDLQRVAVQQGNGGLSGLSKALLGLGLNKRMRMSDWEARPLSKSQLDYAALDAAVLIRLYDIICSSPSLPMPKTSFRAMLNYNDEESNIPVMELDSETPCASHDNLVSATCELLGIPIPGLLKSELFNFAQAARLPFPIFTITCIRTMLGKTAYHSTVEVAGTTFFGPPASTKKDSEYWAAREALVSLLGGHSESKVQSTCSVKRLQTLHSGQKYRPIGLRQPFDKNETPSFNVSGIPWKESFRSYPAFQAHKLLLRISRSYSVAANVYSHKVVVCKHARYRKATDLAIIYEPQSTC